MAPETTLTKEQYFLPTLKNRSEFQSVRSGKRFVCENFILQAKMSNKQTTQPRVGYTITKKTGNSVVRSRIRRRLKHALVQSLDQTSKDKVQHLGDMVLVAKRGVLTTSYSSLVEQLTKGIDRLASKGNKAR